MTTQPYQQPKGNPGRRGRAEKGSIISRETLKSIIIDGDAAVTVREADRIGKLLTEGKESERLSTSQIRAIFGEVRKIEKQINIPGHKKDEPKVQEMKRKAFRRLHLLIPKMKYRVAKERNKQGIKKLVEVLVPSVELVVSSNADSQERDKRFANFVEFFEAILAYHRAHGGK